jgi:dipeptidyl aminopeptidase/acylaminoacyl peptidase
MLVMANAGDQLMRASLTLMMLVAICPKLPAEEAQVANPGNVLISRAVIELPPFEEIRDRPLIHLYATEDDYTLARTDSGFMYERITYSSDGLEVVALLYQPTNNNGPMPTIVFNRGSYLRNQTAPEYLVSFNRFAQAGYAVLAPMYRGSEGAEGEDEMGGEDLNDLMRVTALADELPTVDASNLFLLGESRGGMMVLQAIRDGFPAHAAAIYGSPTDFFSLFDQYPDQYEGIADQLWPDWRTNRPSVLGRRSAITWAEEIDVPILIMHGANDQSMPVTQSLSFAKRLSELGKVFELHVVGYENHMISGHAGKRDALAIAWYEKHSGEKSSRN